jgi:eukaryotic-like serine/threonine-protein kinase
MEVQTEVRKLKGERWQNVEQIFHAALELDVKDRASLLERECGGDESLRREVESLIQYGRNAGSAFETPCLDIVAQALAKETKETGANEKLIGARVANYQITSALGHGGMGLVYRAIRSDDTYKKEVAIKLVRPGLDSDIVYRRFRSERQILAALEHENIARLLDGGATEQGVPYFVMELVEGQPIDEYCDARKLSIADRIQLFQHVCSAVQYAHQHLVVHRDLKPKNVLVTVDGVPKLLDFGIATILSPETLPGADPTVTVAGMMTPEYASPEQLRREAITTATDVYSLGLVLYKLLTGRMPYRPAGDSAYDLAHAICQLEPDKPSATVRRVERESADAGGAPNSIGITERISEARSTTPDRLQRTLSGDLDQILLKALRKEPQQRYSSVQSFAQDLRMYLAGMPVSARHGTFAYRANKFIRRNKLVLAATAAALLMTVAGVAAIVREVRIARTERALAEKRFNDVRALANSLLFDVHDAIQDLPGTTPARKLLVERALKYLDGLSLENSSDASLKAETAAAYEKIGDVQGNPDVANLGDPASAIKSYRHALELRQSIHGSGAETENDELDLVSDHEKIGETLIKLNDRPGALEEIQEAVRIDEDLARSGADARVQDSLAGAHFELARGLAAIAKYPEALDHYRRAAAIREVQHGDSPAIQARIQTRLAGTYGLMAGTLSHLGDFDQAIVMQSKARDIMVRLSQAASQNATYSEFASEGYYWVGFFQIEKGMFNEARQNLEAARSGFEALSTSDPADSRARGYIGLIDRSLGVALAAQGENAKGLESLHKSLTIFQGLADAEHSSNVDSLGNIADTESAITDIYLKMAKAGDPSKSATTLNWQQARSWSEKTFNSWITVQNHGSIYESRLKEPERLKQNIALCDRMLHAAKKSTIDSQP